MIVHAAVDLLQEKAFFGAIIQMAIGMPIS